MTLKRLRSLFGPLLVGGFLAGCSLVKPLPRETDLTDRLAAFPTTGLPVEGQVTVHWNDHQVPFIEADTDADAAFALGLVHAHLRLGQMAVYKRISQGRIAEMGGPLAADIDHGLRILDYGRAADASVAALPEATRVWLQRFVDGINHYQRTVDPLPHEYTVLALEREPWTIQDVLTFGRLAGTDVNWLVWFNLLKLRGRDDWPQVWARLVENGSDSVPSFDADEGTRRFTELLAGLSRSGSNSLALAPSRTKTGSALLANDPHLGLSIPNAWLLAGVKSPSYHAVGLMVPGLPFVAVGRNPSIAWGGTNMRAASSELFDLSGEPADELRQRTDTINVRWWFDREITVRDSVYGPVLSDAPQLSDTGTAPFALKWTGHRPSDEVSAMLAVMKASSFAEFRAAFETFAVPGQNMLYADTLGNIGQVMAVQVPRRNGAPSDVILDPAERESVWQSMAGADDLPAIVNPESGFLASANNRPSTGDTPVGYFFSPDDRVARMAELGIEAEQLDVADLTAVQRDVFMPSSVALRDAVIAKLDESGLSAAADGQAAEAIRLMREWDGHYRADARGPVAFELFRAGFTGTYLEGVYGEADWQAFANVSRIKKLLLDEIVSADPAALAPAMQRGLDLAAEKLGDYASWGEMHRLRLAHPLQFLPIVGNRFRFADLPVGGSSDTLMKTAHGTEDGRHYTRYGANARHISDLSDIDANDFVLLGGQDGWFNSSTFLDQVPLWRSGTYIRLPLRLESVQATFPHRMELRR